jgi:hypothetical protein
MHRRVAAPEDFLVKETIMEISNTRIARGARTLLALAATLLALAGCGGSGGADSSAPSGGLANGGAQSGSCANGDCGTLLLSLTDAEGDFASYSVDVLSIELERANGATVETLPKKVRIDFAQLTDLSDLLSVTTLAPGDFVGGTIRLDYSNAEVFVEKDGEVVQARVVDENGQPLGQTELEIRLADRNHLVITRGRAAFLAVDFDLAASHELDLTTTPPVARARPYIVAEVQPVDEKDLRIRGALVSVDAAASSYTVDLRPWHENDGALGRFTIHTTAQTSFEIDGAAATGAAGLAALAQKPGGTMTVAFGSLATQSREFTAEIVHAGTSVSGETFDAVHGNVVSRSGDVLTVKGAFAVRRDRQTAFRRTVLVQLGPDTKVLKAGSMQVLRADAISVGQRIVAIGALREPASSDPSIATPPTLDATAGRVRMLVTELHGTVESVVAGQLTMQLRAIDRLGIDMFDFAGTGVTSAQDADPAHYEVGTGALALAQVAPGEAAKVIGFVAPFGSAPPDFEGRTVVDRRELPDVLGIGWGETGTTAPFLSMGPSGLVLDIDNPSIGLRHFLVAGGRKIDLLELPSSPTLAPANGRTLYGITEPGHVELFASFDEFVAELSVRLGAGDAVLGLSAYGSYDESSNTLTANRISAYFGAAD